ncbi:type III effector protein [Streptomyces sp. NPDC059398]|uniref:type III effector protein n=1 Tax=Streptomyces sp. NPDC059398 TaxID=3346820 RepID=UPI0036BC842D
MTAADQPPHADADARSPASFLAAAAALEVIDHAVCDAHDRAADPADADAGPQQALASLLLLREIREQLAGWETGLIETARHAGASWADLAHPLGVASRQAAERRYLRNRPGSAGTTGEQRVQATRESRAANRAHTAWARDNAAALRRLAGQITALTDLPRASRAPLGRLDAALAHNDPAALVPPLTAARPYLSARHSGLATQLDTLIGQNEQHPGRPGPE